jgi:hypothetical protein
MDENQLVDDGEMVYRRIAGVYYNPTLPIPVQREAFRPTEHDTSGLSVLRANFARPEDTLAHLDPAKAKGYHVARLAVCDLRKLGLTVLPEPISGGPPGHAVIPELSWPAYEADKQRLKQTQIELAKLASAAIVHWSA